MGDKPNMAGSSPSRLISTLHNILHKISLALVRGLFNARGCAILKHISVAGCVVPRRSVVYEYARWVPAEVSRMSHDYSSRCASNIPDSRLLLLLL